MKNGDGRFLYLDKGQMYTGFWVNDVAKCGTVEDFDRDSAPEPPKYPIPEVCACSQGREQCCNVSITEGSVFILIPLHTIVSHMQCSLMDSSTVLDIAKEEHKTGPPS